MAVKHRVSNFGSEALQVIQPPGTVTVMVQPGQVWEGEIDRITCGQGRVHYSVRPAERLPIPDPMADQDED